MSKKNMPATPFLRASPNPVPIGCDPGTTTINWSAGHEEAEVYVTRDGEQEKPFAQGSHGSQDAPWINRGSTYQFRLYGRGPRITPLATVTVRPCEATAPIWEPGCVSFYCNICGQACLKKLEELERESRSCAGCGSTVRWRSVIHALSIELFGESIPLSDFPVMPEITGIGMSDWNGYAIPLAQKFSYQNTYYHQDPKLDITAIDPALEGKFDFIISSDVFEHIAPPVSAAFENVRKLLKPNGALVFTVPYWKHDRTVEHFPELCDYKILEKNGNYVLMNTT